MSSSGPVRATMRPGETTASCGILERVEADEPHAERLRRRQRCLDQPCFGPGTEHENAMRKQRADERQHHRVAHEQQSEQRQRDRQQPFVIGGDGPGQQLRDRGRQAECRSAGARITRTMYAPFDSVWLRRYRPNAPLRQMIVAAKKNAINATSE